MNKDKFRLIFLGGNKYKRRKFVKICPKCGSIKIKTDFTNPAVWAYGTAPKYKCNSCGYLGNLFPEVSEEQLMWYKKELKTQIREGKLRFMKEDLIDASTGFYAGVWEMVAGLLLLPLILISLIVSFARDPYDYRVFFEKNSSLVLTALLGTVFLVYIALRTFKYIRNR